MADLHGELLVAQRRHHMDQFFQKQVARRQQQIKQDQRLGHARQKSPGPVKHGTGAAVVFDLHRRGDFLLFLFFRFGCAQIADGRRRRAKACAGRKKFLNPLPQVGHVLWRVIHPLQRRPAELNETNDDNGNQQGKHGRRRNRHWNLQGRRPADERFERHARQASQHDWQDDGTGEVKKGDHAQHEQTNLGGPCIGR